MRRRPRDMTPSRLAAAVAATALFGLGAAGCGSQAGAAAGQGPPQKLRLANSATATAAPGGTGAPSSAPPIIMPLPAPPAVPGWAQIKLTGRLPASGPASGAIRRLPGGAAPESAVRALAGALHLSGSPQRVTGGWRVTGPGTLQVTDGPGMRWRYLGVPVIPSCGGPILRARQPTAGAANMAGSGGGTGSHPGAAVPSALDRICPVKPGQPSEPVPAPSGSAAGPSAESVAKPVLQAAGVAESPLRITTIGSFTFVSVDPTVAGLATSGFTTTIGVGPGERITQAAGWLSHPARGSSYPLIGAQQAFNQLKLSTRPIPGAHPPEVMCPLNPDVLCGTPGPIRAVQVTGATYGLALSYNRGEPVLVPSWLFSVAGTSLKIPEVAINPRDLNG